MAITSLSRRIEGRSSALVLGMISGILMGNVLVLVSGLNTDVVRDPEIIREMGGKPKRFRPLWIPISAIGAGAFVGAVIGAVSWKQKSTHSDGITGAPPLPFWAIISCLVVSVVGSYWIYQFVWEPGPFYVRRFDT